MSEAPERVYLDGDVEAGDGMFPRCFENPKYASEPPVEYIRADRVTAMLKAEREKALREAVENEKLKTLVCGILPQIERAIEDFWDWQDEGPYGAGWQSKENTECYELIKSWIVDVKDALKGKENPAG